MGNVRLVRQHKWMEHLSLGPYNPHPAFPLWSPHAVYPYPFWGSMTCRRMRQRYFLPYIENEFLRVTVATDIGGRVWDIYDKIGKRHLANYNTSVHSYNAGFGLNYTTGGIECNYPLAHACTTNAPREISFRQHPDGSAEIITSEYERIWRTRWMMSCRLYPGRAYVEQRVRLYNRTPDESRYLYWNNCGFVLHDNTQFLFPEESGARHGREATTFSWPRWRHHDLSLFKDIPPQALGLYFLNAREPYFGYYDHDGQFGLVHYADLADLPGKKSWTWGYNPKTSEYDRAVRHSEKELYGEIQSGRIVIQEHLDRLPADSECEWTERWYPIRGTGAVNAAGPGAALRAELLESAGKASRIRITVMANASYPDAVISVTSDGSPRVERPLALDPSKPTECVVTMRGKAGPDQHTCIVIRDGRHDVLVRHEMRRPSERDCWREVVEVRQSVEPVGAEELFRAAEVRARDWDNHDDLAALYEKVLRQDSAFSPARRELGRLALRKGQYEEAVRHLDIARQRDPDSLEIRHLLGVALLRAGRVEDARRALESAARSDWEVRALARLAEISMREQDWRQALKHLSRIASAQPRLTRQRGLLAICWRKLGCAAEAAAEIADARRIDGQDPFLQLEEMIAGSGTVRRLPRRGLKPLLNQVRQAEEPLLEAVFDYLNAGLDAEAETVLRSVPRRGPLANIALAWVEARLGRASALRTLREACKQDPAYQHAWRLEMVPMLQWAAEQLPRHPRPLWHLGNLLMARGRTEEGAQLWRKAERLGERHYLLFASLGYYEKNVSRNRALALRNFLRADSIARTDLYVKHEAFESLMALGRESEARAYLRGQTEAVAASPRLAGDLANLYLKRNEFRAFDNLCRRSDFSANWQISGPNRLWAQRWIQEGLILARRGKLREALTALLDIEPMPPRLALAWHKDLDDDRRFYHIGRIYEKLGQMDKAREYWERAIALPHYCGYEIANTFQAWCKRYFHALCMQKLGLHSEANAYFDAMELLAQNPDLPLAAREKLMDLVERGRFGPEDAKDPAAQVAVEVATRAEL